MTSSGRLGRRSIGSVFTILSLLTMFSGSAPSFAEMRTVQITGEGPTTYSDGSVLPVEKRPSVIYTCLRIDEAGEVVQTLGNAVGIASCSGNVDMTFGSTYRFTMTATLDGLTSDQATPVSYTFQAPPPVIKLAVKPPTVLTMGTDNVIRWDKPSVYTDGVPVDITTLDRFAVYVFAMKSDGAWQYVGQTPSGGTGGEYYQLPGNWWKNNVAAGELDFPLPKAGDTFTFTVATRHFVEGNEYVSDMAPPITYTFPTGQEPPPQPPGVPIILDVVAQIEGQTYTVRLEGIAVPQQ